LAKPKLNTDKNRTVNTVRFKVLNVILCGFKIPSFKFAANVRTLNELTNNNFGIILKAL